MAGALLTHLLQGARQVVKGLLGEIHELGERHPEPPQVAAHSRDLDALGCAPQPQAALGEFLDRNGAAAVVIQQLEDVCGLVDVEAQVLQVRRHFVVCEVVLELCEGNVSGLIFVKKVEQFPELLLVLRPVADLLCDDLVLVLGADVRGADAEEARDDVEEGEQREGDEDEEDGHHGPVHLLEVLRRVTPAHPAGHAEEECVRGLGHRPPVAVELCARGRGESRLQHVLGRGLGEECREEVHHEGHEDK
mmetsp:Transcript_54193/g.168043  ORF Transcript_54193/g.168043 Transcript_54193/m.168043 type:complete len:249 (-) Transcript_54193:1038-1784(-)